MRRYWLPAPPDVLPEPEPLPDTPPLPEAPPERSLELPDVLPAPLPLPLGLSMRWLLEPLLLPLVPLPLVPLLLPLPPRSQAAKPPATNADTRTAVKMRCLLMVSLSL